MSGHPRRLDRREDLRAADALLHAVDADDGLRTRLAASGAHSPHRLREIRASSALNPGTAGQHPSSTTSQLFGFILGGVSMNEVGSASGVLEAVQQLSTSLGVAILGTVFFSVFGDHLATDALQVTARACLAPLTLAFLLVFRLPMRARQDPAE